MPGSIVNTKYRIHQVQHTPSTAYTEYSIHRVQHTPSTAYTEYSIHRVQHTLSTTYTAYRFIRRSNIPHSQPVSHLSANHVVLNSPHSPTYELTNEWCFNFCAASLPPDLQPPDRPPPCTLSISLDHGLQVHPHTRSITATKCISELARLPPPRSQHIGLQVHFHRCSLTAFKSISNSLDQGLEVHLQLCSITALNCISKLAESRSLHSPDHCLQVYPQCRTYTASKFKRSWQPRGSTQSLDHNLGVFTVYL